MVNEKITVVFENDDLKCVIADCSGYFCGYVIFKTKKYTEYSHHLDKTFYRGITCPGSGKGMAKIDLPGIPAGYGCGFDTNEITETPYTFEQTKQCLLKSVKCLSYARKHSILEIMKNCGRINDFDYSYDGNNDLIIFLQFQTLKEATKICKEYDGLLGKDNYVTLWPVE